MYNSLRQSQLLDVSGITEISIMTLITSDNVNGYCAIVLIMMSMKHAVFKEYWPSLVRQTTSVFH